MAYQTVSHTSGQWSTRTDDDEDLIALTHDSDELSSIGASRDDYPEAQVNSVGRPITFDKIWPPIIPTHIQSRIDPSHRQHLGAARSSSPTEPDRTAAANSTINPSLEEEDLMDLTSESDHPVHMETSYMASSESKCDLEDPPEEEEDLIDMTSETDEVLPMEFSYECSLERENLIDMTSETDEVLPVETSYGYSPEEEDLIDMTSETDEVLPVETLYEHGPEDEEDLMDLTDESYTAENPDESNIDSYLDLTYLDLTTLPRGDPLFELADDSDSDSEVDIRDMFLVMPKRREELRRLKAEKERLREERRRTKVLSRRLEATKVQFKDFERLPDDIKLHVMRHTNSNDIRNLVLSGTKIGDVWKSYPMAVLRGIQEEQFAEFNGIFMRIGGGGSYFKPLYRNFKNAVRTFIYLDACKKPEFRTLTKDVVRYGTQNEWMQLSLLGLCKEHLDREVDALHSHSADFARKDQIVRRGLLTMWHMRWEENAFFLHHLWSMTPGNTEDVVKALVQIFEDQPASVRSSITAIVSLVIHATLGRFNLEVRRQIWVPLYCDIVTAQPIPNEEDPDQWSKKALVALILRSLLINGVAETLHMTGSSHQDWSTHPGNILADDLYHILKDKMLEEPNGKLPDRVVEIMTFGAGVCEALRLVIPDFLDYSKVRKDGSSV